MKLATLFRKVFVPALLVFSFSSAQAAIITSTAGNGAHGLTDGAVTALVPDVLNAQAGQAAPFDTGYGNELFGNPPLLNWAFPGLPIITDTILSATLTIGVFDVDTASSGSQLDQFLVDGVDQTAAMDALFEAANSGDNVYNEFTLNLGAGFFASLADGSFTAGLDVGGTGLQTALIGGAVSETGQNGFHLIFAELEITTQDPTTPPPTGVPEPGSLLLFAFAMLGIRRLSRR